ncbi:helix-turn-helix domain-containing protein [Candidatus Magnetominusculus dajiuhuensis]|uniref:helix-turn-helix domain-containing protein n=1 Tax=Candidatus Magnetominusculus dajiuhuensis TaxID=3137712 RepID=UPI003B435C5F
MSSKILDADIFYRIKLVRKKYRLSQKEFASELGVSQGFLSELESGKYKPTKIILLAIAYLYPINIDWLLTGKGGMYKPGTDHPIPIEDIPKETIKEWIDEFWGNATEDEKGWLKVQFPLTFPQFKDWLLKKQSAGVEGQDDGIGAKDNLA